MTSSPVDYSTVACDTKGTCDRCPGFNVVDMLLISLPAASVCLVWSLCNCSLSPGLSISANMFKDFVTE